MKIVLCQPAVIRFKWELKVLLTNLKELHFPLNDVVLLFASEEDSYASFFRREFGIQPVVIEELSFSWAVDNIDSWDKHKIYHNSGVTADMKDLFYKGAYLDKEPFTADLSQVNQDKASYKYVEAIQKVK